MLGRQGRRAPPAVPHLSAASLAEALEQLLLRERGNRRSVSASGTGERKAPVFGRLGLIVGDSLPQDLSLRAALLARKPRQTASLVLIEIHTCLPHASSIGQHVG